MCSVTFHVIAITCVVWSLYVLIDRTAEEIKQGQTTGMLLAYLPTYSPGVIIDPECREGAERKCASNVYSQTSQLQPEVGLVGKHRSNDTLTSVNSSVGVF